MVISAAEPAAVAGRLVSLSVLTIGDVKFTRFQVLSRHKGQIVHLAHVNEVVRVIIEPVARSNYYFINAVFLRPLQGLTDTVKMPGKIFLG